MATILTKFNEQLINFLQEMCNLFPNDKKLSTFLFTVDLMKKANPLKFLEDSSIRYHSFYLIEN